MNRYLNVLKTVSLFKGIEEADLLSLLSCLSPRILHFKPNEAVFLTDGSVGEIGIVLSGQVRIVHEDFYGNKNILSSVGAGELFAEAFAFAEVKKLPVSVFSSAASEIMLLDSKKIIAVCPKACTFHNTLIFNMLKIVAAKNIFLSRKIEIISKRTTREKLLAFLSSEAERAGGASFPIQFNRQELADFLSVDRSAMSAELCRMRDEGILEFEKNRFLLK